MFESGLRTIPYANRVAQGRLFLYIKSSIRKAFLAFSRNLSQPTLIYINLLMASASAGISRLDNICSHTNPLKGYSLWL